MPLYEYYCPDCQTPFSAWRSFTEYDQPGTCPQCGCEEGRRLISNIVTVSADASGARRVIAGGSPCSGCASAAIGCSGGCSVRR